MKNNPLHSGIVERTEFPFVYVRIVQHSACSGCHAKSACMAADSAEKIIQVEDRTGQYRVNDVVWLYGEQRLGLQAVGLAFVIPVVLMLVTMVVVDAYYGEIAAALAGLAVLIPYYILIYLLRDRLKRRFAFSISKINR